MEALQLVAWKQPPAFRDVSVPEPGPGQVLVRVGGAGARHSDLHLMHDFAPGTVLWEPPPAARHLVLLGDLHPEP